MKQAVLIGPPNCGKSTLFRLMTGKHVQTGNRAGVTVEARTAQIPGTDWLLTDLPGIRSVHPNSADEAVTVKAVEAVQPDLVLAVADATVLAVQYPILHTLQDRYFSAVPTVLLLNTCDELERPIEAQALQGFLPAMILPISARTGMGIERLRTLFQSSAALPCPAFLQPERLAELLQRVGTVSKQKARTMARLDRWLLHPVWGFVIFTLIGLTVLWLTFGAIGSYLTDWFCSLCLSPVLSLVHRLSLPEWLRALLTDGFFGGVGAVLEFLPRMLLLFLLQSFLEQSGYLARAARIFDPVLKHFGLRGDAITPLLLGFGCSVPAVLCTRGMKDHRSGRRCACFLPTVACSARIPLCITVSNAFFPGNGWWICALLWLASGICFLLFCFLDARPWQKSAPLCCHWDDLPRLRLPAAADWIDAVCEQLTHFFTRAGGTILLTSLAVWLLSHTQIGRPGLVPVSDSLLAYLGSRLAPLLAPIGLQDWRLVAALLAGLGAKEATLSTLGVLLETGGRQGVGEVLLSSGLLSARSALSFLIFYLLYAPCTATLSVQPRPRKWLLPFGFAYFVALAVYRL